MVALAAAVPTVLGGLLVHLTLGALYTFDNMNPYITSYMREHNISDVEYGDSVWIFASAGMASGASMAFSGFLEQKIGTKASVLLGAWLSSLGVLLTYFTIQVSFALTVLTYGIFVGLGNGLAIPLPMISAMRWFPRHKGLVNGIISAGFGGGAFIFDNVQTAFVNPQNLKPNVQGEMEIYFGQSSLLNRVPYCFLFLGGIYAGAQLIGVIFIRNPPGFTFTPPIPKAQRKAAARLMGKGGDKSALLDYEVYDPSRVTPGLTYHEGSGLQDTGPPRGEDTAGVELTPTQALKRLDFYKLWFSFLLNGTNMVFIMGLYKAYGLTFIDDDRFLALTGSIGSLFNGGGRIMWGRIADCFSFRTAMITLCICVTILLLCLQFVSLGGKPMYMIWFCLLLLSFSGNFNLYLTVVSRAFGTRYAVKTYGLLMTSQIIASLLGAVIASQLKDALGWTGMFYFLSGLSVVSLGLIYTFRVKTTDGLKHV